MNANSNVNAYGYDLSVEDYGAMQVVRYHSDEGQVLVNSARYLAWGMSLLPGPNSAPGIVFDINDRKGSDAFHNLIAIAKARELRVHG